MSGSDKMLLDIGGVRIIRGGGLKLMLTALWSNILFWRLGEIVHFLISSIRVSETIKKSIRDLLVLITALGWYVNSLRRGNLVRYGSDRCHFSHRSRRSCECLKLGGERILKMSGLIIDTTCCAVPVTPNNYIGGVHLHYAVIKLYKKIRIYIIGSVNGADCKFFTL